MSRQGSRALAVLGMHRSGTSCLAGVLEAAGLFLGDVARANRFNARGNLENAQIWRLNDEVLAQTGGAWDRPPPRLSWTEAQRHRRNTIVASYDGHPYWGFKDPRLLLTLEGWKEVLPHLEFVGIYRHPLSVARSLKARTPALGLDKGLLLWAHYNRRLLALWRERPFPLVSFDLSTPEFNASVATLCGKVGLSSQTVVEPAFFDETLRHQAIESARGAHLPHEIDVLYRELNSIAFATDGSPP